MGCLLQKNLEMGSSLFERVQACARTPKPEPKHHQKHRVPSEPTGPTNDGPNHPFHLSVKLYYYILSNSWLIMGVIMGGVQIFSNFVFSSFVGHV